MSNKRVDKINGWFDSAIVALEIVHEPILRLATGNCLTGFHRDNLPPTSVVASLLRGRKLLLFPSHGSRTVSIFAERPEWIHLEQFMEDLVSNRYPNISYCVQEAGDTVCILARTVHFVLRVTLNNEWNSLLSHNIKYNESEAAKMEPQSFNYCNDQRVRIVEGKRIKRSGATKKRFTARSLDDC